MFELNFKKLINYLVLTSIVFLSLLIIFTGVNIQNEVKEGRYIGQDIENKNKITVSATGEVYAKPDLVLTTFSVVNEAKTVTAAMAENTEKMNSVIAFAKGKGVEDRDLKTTSFNIYPRYEWMEKDMCFPPCPSGRRVLVGYEVSQSLQVKIRDMSKIGEIIEGATAAGANEVGGLQFTIDNQNELKNQAREKAVEEAKDKAKELASLLGIDLVRITNFSESSALPYYDYLMGFELAEGRGGGETPQIETGENKISVTVTITYEIN